MSKKPGADIMATLRRGGTLAREVAVYGVEVKTLKNLSRMIYCLARQTQGANVRQVAVQLADRVTEGRARDALKEEVAQHAYSATARVHERCGHTLGVLIIDSRGRDMCPASL